MHDRKCQAGFTLVELMITVAILGILAAVAIPTFQAFRIKSVRSEAYLLLGGIYDAEVAFFAQRNYYNVSLLQVGFSVGGPPTPNNRYCKEGAALVCGKYYAAFVPYSSENKGFIAIATGVPDTANPLGVDEFIIRGP